MRWGFWAAAAASVLLVAGGRARAEQDYGLGLVGRDPYGEQPVFYSAYPDDYPKGCCAPARPTSYWHRWYRMSPALWRDCRDAKLVEVERRIGDFESDAEVKELSYGRLTFFAAALGPEHATSGKHAVKITVGSTVEGRLPVIQFPVGGDSQQRHTDNWRWIRMDVFNATGRDLVIGFNKVSRAAERGFGPTFVVKPGANTVACKTAELEGYFYHRGPSGYTMSRFYMFLFAKEGDVLHVDNVRLVQEVGEVLSKRGRLFDFGSGEDVENDRGTHGGVFPGWTGVAADTAYAKERGFGWEGEGGDRRSVTMYHRHTHALLNDWVSMYQPGATFRVDLPNDRYRVWLMGQVALRDAGLTVQGEDVTARVTRRAPARPEVVGYDVDLIKGDSGWLRYKMPRNFVEVEFEAKVTDGHLSITFDPGKGSRRYGLGIYAMAVYPMRDEAEAKKEIGYLKAVTLTEASEADHGWIQPAYMEERNYGGAHEECLHPEKTPGKLEALAPAPHEKAQGYILFTRPFTETVYFDTVPARAEADALKAEQAFAGCPGEFVPVTVGVYPLADLTGASLGASALRSAEGAVIPADAIDVRVERYDERWVNNTHEDGTPYLYVPYYLVHREKVDLEAGLSRRFVADLRIPPDARPGTYRGSLSFSVEGRPGTEIPLAVEVLPFTMVSPDVFFAAPAKLHPLYLDYGFNTLKADREEAEAKRLRGRFVVGEGKKEAAGKFIESIDDRFRTRVADGVAGKTPRVFFTSLWAAGHQYQKPDAELVGQLRKAAPALDVLGANDTLFWFTDFRHSGPYVLLTAENVRGSAGTFTWLCDAVEPSKELAARFTFGLWLWRSGLNGRLSYANAWNPYELTPETDGGLAYGGGDWVIDWEVSNLPLVSGSSFAFFLKDPDGKPCPSRDFINIREGITDYRYVHTLERSLDAARRAGGKDAAVQAAAACLEKLRTEIHPDLTRYFDAWGPQDAGGENWYLKTSSGLTAGRLERIRAEVRRAVVDLQGAGGPGRP